MADDDNFIDWDAHWREEKERWREERVQSLNQWKDKAKRILQKSGQVGTNMFIESSAILNAPGGRRERAMRAISKGISNKERQQSLCNDLQSQMWKDDLLSLAKDLDLPITNKITKAELCQKISEYVESSHAIQPSLPLQGKLRIPVHLMKELYDNDLARSDIEAFYAAQRIYHFIDSMKADKNISNEDMISRLKDDLANQLTDMAVLPPFVDGDNCYECLMNGAQSLVPQVIRAYQNDGGKNRLSPRLATS